MNIERDHTRFKQIVRGKIRENLRKYVTHGEMIGRKGRDLVSIPVPQLDVPHFRYGKNGSGGVGQGDGEVGDPVGKPGPGQGGAGGAGSDPGGGHVLEVEISLDELAEILGDELELPRIEPKGKANIEAEKSKYNSIRQTGPESLRHFRRTYLQALRRQISTGAYEPDDPRVVPMKQDKQYRSWNDVPNPQVNAVVIYMMDVSGSMTDEQKEIVRTEAFWIDTWLGSQYHGVEKRYIIHDAAAKEVDEHTFYHTRESGGTRISSAYKAAAELIDHSVSARRLEHLLLPVFRRRQLGRRQPPSVRAAARQAAAGGEPVLLRPGRKPLRQRRVHRRAGKRIRRPRKARPLGNRRQRSHLRVDSHVSGEREISGQMTDADTDAIRQCIRSLRSESVIRQSNRPCPCPTGNLTPELAAIQVEIEAHARRYGLDFYPTIFELVDSDQLNAIAAYGGFPTRYPHWRFGMEYEQLSKGYTTGCRRSTRW